MLDVFSPIVDKLSVVKANSEIHEAYIDDLSSVLEFLVEKSGSESEPVEYCILRNFIDSLENHYWHFDAMIDGVFAVINTLREGDVNET